MLLFLVPVPFITSVFGSKNNKNNKPLDWLIGCIGQGSVGGLFGLIRCIGRGSLAGLLGLIGCIGQGSLAGFQDDNPPAF